MAENAVLQFQMAIDDSPDRLASDLAYASKERRLVERFVERQLRSLMNGRPAKFSVRVDSSTTGSGNDPLERAAPTITITFANITAGETILIGAKTLTWAVAAANENEVTIGADLAAAKANLIAAINAHSKLEGLFFAKASAVAAEVYIYFLGGSRVGTVMPSSETGDALALSATTFDGDTTDAHVDSSDVLEVARDLGLYGS
jgi:hypothetical protein